ncbi:MAG: hypothetical protein JNN04_04320 [Cyclobacteriaceae bacterium]|nr:hypothetical protein [Cyclobacteriaceae bacterium]
MNNELSYKGFWWTPSQPKNKFPGELEIDQTGTLVLTILVDQNYSEYFTEESDRNNKIQIINGYARNTSTKKDLAFTLFDNSIYSYHVSGLAEFKIQSRFAVTTKHYSTTDELRLSSAFIEFRLLKDWIDVSGVKVKHKTKRKFKLTVDYDQPEPITLLKTNDYHLYLWFYAKTGGSVNGFKIEEMPRINIEFKKEIKFEEFIKYYELIKNFFSFCISVPITSDEIEFYEHSKSTLKKHGVKHQNRRDLILSDTRTYTKQTTLQNRVMLLDYETLKGQEGRLIQKWLELNVKYEPVFKLYFDTLYNPDLYKENAFLNYVSAIEIYHRIQNPEFDGRDDSYRRELEAVLSEITTPSKRSWVEIRLRKRKEMSLFNRLKDIVNRTPTISKRLAGDELEFSRKVANTRHYFTHFNQADKKMAVTDSKGLLELMFKMKIYLQIQILLDMGFQESEANSLTKKAISNWFEWNR